MEEEGENFNCKWNDHADYICNSLHELRKIDKFFDVTFVCEDGEHVKTHKIILSANSAFLHQILQCHDEDHPVLQLQDVKQEDVQALLTYMYLGEVNVAEHQLSTFLCLANELKIKGLTQDNEVNSAQTKRKLPQTPEPAMTKLVSLSPRKQSSSPLPSMKKLKASPLIRQPNIALGDSSDESMYEDDDIVVVEGEGAANNVGHAMSDQQALSQYNNSAFNSSFGGMNNHTAVKRLDDLGEQYLTKGDGMGFICTMCNKSFRDKYHGKRHLEVAHFPMPDAYSCQKCLATFDTKRQWENHARIGCSLKSKKSRGVRRHGITENPDGLSLDVLFNIHQKKTEDDNKSYVCLLCSKLSGSHMRAKEHLESCHFPSYGQYQCEYCNKVMDTSKAYKGHIYAYHKNKNTEQQKPVQTEQIIAEDPLKEEQKDEVLIDKDPLSLEV